MEIQQLTRRPGTGTLGSRSQVRTNFFEVLAFPKGIIAHYDVTITPVVPPRLNIKIFNRFVELYRDTDLVGTRPVYDGMWTPTLFIKNFFSNYNVLYIFVLEQDVKICLATKIYHSMLERTT